MITEKGNAMIVKAAKNIARHWVQEEGRQLPSFAGAFFHGSINWLADDAILSPTSDVDVMVVLAGPEPAVKLGKFVYQGVLLEVSYLSLAEVESPEVILGQSHLAGSFQGASVIADPTGQLTAVQSVVAQQYAQRRWVYARCADARTKVLRNLQSLDATAPFHDQVLAWLFGTGVTTHILLAAGLKNPTVRKRYSAVRDLLAEYEHSDFYEPLLALLGCTQMSQAQAAEHLAALTAVFDVAKTVIKTPFFFASDISDLSRPIAIDGSREMIERGEHREAVFWLVATYARCQKVLYQDAPLEVQEQFTPGFHRLLADLGITSFADMQRRGEQVKAFLPQVWVVAEEIMAANRGIEG
jgi:hypothetical protein